MATNAICNTKGVLSCWVDVINLEHKPNLDFSFGIVAGSLSKKKENII